MTPLETFCVLFVAGIMIVIVFVLDRLLLGSWRSRSGGYQPIEEASTKGNRKLVSGPKTGPPPPPTGPKGGSGQSGLPNPKVLGYDMRISKKTGSSRLNDDLFED